MVSLIVGCWELTGNQVIERPARKYPPTVLRLARLEDYETDEGEELTSNPNRRASVLVLLEEERSISQSHPNPNNNDSDEVDDDHSNISGVQRQAGAGSCTSCEASGVGSCNTPIHKASLWWKWTSGYSEFYPLLPLTQNVHVFLVWPAKTAYAWFKSCSWRLLVWVTPASCWTLVLSVSVYHNTNSFKTVKHNIPS